MKNNKTATTAPYKRQRVNINGLAPINPQTPSDPTKGNLIFANGRFTGKVTPYIPASPTIDIVELIKSDERVQFLSTHKGPEYLHEKLRHVRNSNDLSRVLGRPLRRLMRRQGRL